MDGIRTVDPVKKKGSKADQHPSNTRARFVEPLTPLHRLARFKEIRDRNLARSRNSVQNKRNSVVMDTVMTGGSKNEMKSSKIKSSEKLSNGNDEAHPHTNGVENTTNGNSLIVEPSLGQNDVISEADVESEKTSRKENVGNGDEIVVETESRSGTESEMVSSNVCEKAKEEEQESDGGQESEGSSVDVVGESSSESLNLQVSRPSSEEASDTTSSRCSKPAPKSEEPKVVTPEIVRKIRSGRIAARRNLRGEVNTPAKRKHDDNDDDLSTTEKKSRNDGTLSSPGWQFFSPTKSISKMWSTFRTPTIAEAGDVDESMIVNYDDQSNIFEKINDETATTLIEESQEKPANKWCSLM